jgi:multidrug efflux pump subunit AcrA (membrane-fusion protein)
VTITVTGSTQGLYAGASAEVEIIVRQSTNVLVVPTTAVHTVGTSSYVYLLKNGKEVEQTVTIGAEGTPYTQITSGLKSGQEVVIASLSSSLSTGSGTTGTGRTGFGGGLGGGAGGFGGGAGGFGGGAGGFGGRGG